MLNGFCDLLGDPARTLHNVLVQIKTTKHKPAYRVIKVEKNNCSRPFAAVRAYAELAKCSGRTGDKITQRGKYLQLSFAVAEANQCTADTIAFVDLNERAAYEPAVGRRLVVRSQPVGIQTKIAKIRDKGGGHQVDQLACAHHAFYRHACESREKGFGLIGFVRGHR